MKPLSLAWAYLKERKDLSSLSVIIIALAVAMVLTTLLVNHQMQGRRYGRWREG
jgi:drug/metabolite transporter superfamily protein YnfA